MPLFPYQSLTITKEVEELIEEECFKDVSPPPEPLIPEMEIPGLGAGVETSVFHSVVPPPPCPPMPGRMGVDLLIDPVSLGWYRSLRVLGYVISFISKIQTKIGTVKNISSGFCSETDLEKVFFLYESRVIRQTLKPEQIKKFECVDDILYYRSRFMDKTQFKFADLDFIPFLDVHEIVGNLPVVLSDSPILYAYIMMIHLSRIQHAGVDITVKAVSNKMFVYQGGKQ